MTTSSLIQDPCTAGAKPGWHTWIHGTWGGQLWGHLHWIRFFIQTRFFIQIQTMNVFQTCGLWEFSLMSSSPATLPSSPAGTRTPSTEHSPTSPCRLFSAFVEWPSTSRAKYDFDFEEFDSITAEAKVIQLSVKVICDLFIFEGLHNASTEESTWEEDDSRQFSKTHVPLSTSQI